MFKKNKERVEEKCIPIFPIYLDTMRIKDTLAIVNDGITNIYSVTKDTTNQSDKEKGIRGSGDLYKVALNVGISKNTAITNKQSEQFERVHTDTSLFYKVLEEFKKNNRIKIIDKQEDIVNSREGDIVLVEGNVYGNEMMDLFNKISAAIETFAIFDQTGNLQQVSGQIKGIEELLATNNKISNTVNMICKLDDNNELLLLLDTKYLIGDTGIELAHGKFKVLGIVYERINEGEFINLARDSMMGLFKEEELQSIYDSLNEGIGNKLNVPKIKIQINGPTLGILPIGIYL